MKKLKIILGILLLSSFVLQAKEVRHIPTIAPVIKIIEKEVVVYKECEKKDGPTGKIKFIIDYNPLYYSTLIKNENELKNVTKKIEKESKTSYKLEGDIAFKGHEFSYEVKGNNPLRFNKSVYGEVKNDAELGYKYSIGRFSEFDTLGKLTYNTEESLKGSLILEHNKTFEEKSFVKKIDTEIENYYKRNFKSDVNTVGISIDPTITFEYDTKLKLGLYPVYEWDKNASVVSLDLKAMLAKEYELYRNGDFGLYLDVSAGLDSFKISKDTKNKDSKSAMNYVVKAEADVVAKYIPNEYFNTFAKLGTHGIHEKEIIKDDKTGYEFKYGPYTALGFEFKF